jgi:hypothetical protein
VLDVMAPLAVLGASRCTTFMVVTQHAVADVAPDDKGLASAIFETPTTSSAARSEWRCTPPSSRPRGGYRAGSATGAVLTALGALSAMRGPARAPVTS